MTVLGSKPLVVAMGAAAAIAVAAPALAQSSPVAGVWDVTMTTPIGDRKSTLTIVPTEENFTIEFTDISGGAPPRDDVSDIRIDGNSFVFKRSVQIQEGLIELNYAGTVDGDALTGKVTSPFGEFALKGIRSR